jgi:hypothetical protein
VVAVVVEDISDVLAVVVYAFTEVVAVVLEDITEALTVVVEDIKKFGSGSGVGHYRNGSVGRGGY